MPKFYFHLHDDYVTLDEEGQEFPNLESAIVAAHSAVRRLLADQLAHEGGIGLYGRIEVEGEGGKLLDTVHFAEAVEIIGPADDDRRNPPSRSMLLEQAGKCRERARACNGRLAATLNAMAESYEMQAASICDCYPSGGRPGAAHEPVTRPIAKR